MSKAQPMTAAHKRERYLAQNLGRPLTVPQLRVLRRTEAAEERRAIARKVRHVNRARQGGAS